MDNIVLKGQDRASLGGRAAARLRREGWTLGNLYGHGLPNVHFQVRRDELARMVAAGHHMMTLDLNGQHNTGLLKEIQYDALGSAIVHVDFARIDLEEVIETTVSVATFGDCKGVAAGGLLDLPHHEIPVRGRANAIPQHLTLAIANLQIGDAIRVRDLVLPEGVEALLDEEEPVVIIHAPKGVESEDEDGAPAEPEVVGEE